jgi:hypothetical protein
VVPIVVLEEAEQVKLMLNMDGECLHLRSSIDWKDSVLPMIVN